MASDPLCNICYRPVKVETGRSNTVHNHNGLLNSLVL